MEKKNIHKDHRQRVRARYMKDGIQSMADHNIVEFLLFFGVPYKDTNDMAHELVDKFGNLQGVLDAPVEELMKINGIGENAAALIKLTHDICVKYNESKQNGKLTMATDNRFMDFLSMKYVGESREIVYLLCVDARGRLLQCAKVCEGSPDSATVDNRTIVETAIRFNANDVILAHNHPNGFAVPSVADVKATESLVPLLRALKINLTDHIIVAGDGCYSMAVSKKYGSIFEY